MPSEKPQSSLIDAFFEESILDPAPVETHRTGFLSKVRSLFGWQDPMTRPRVRREARADWTPAAVQLLEPRVMMSATTVDLDLAQWNNPANGAQAELQPIANVMTFDLAVSPDGTTVAAAEQNGSALLIQAANGQTIRTLSGHTKMITAVEYSPDGSAIATASHDRTLKIWNASTGDLVRTITLPELSGELEWSPDGTMIAAGINPSTMALFDVSTGTLLRSVDNSGEATRFSFSPDGSKIALGDGRTIKIYSTSALQPLVELQGLTEQVYSIDYSSDGRWVIGGDNGGHLAVWNAQTGQLVSLQSDFAGKPSAQGGIWAVAFTKDSRHIIGADFTGKVIVYDATALATNGQLTEVRRYQTGKVPLSIIGSPSNHTFLLTTAESPSTSKIRVFDLPDPLPPPPPPEPLAAPPVEQTEPEPVECHVRILPDDSLNAETAQQFLERALRELATGRMRELQTSIITDASQLPALLRRQAELERELPQQESVVAAQQRIVHTLDVDRLRVEGELALLRQQYDAANARDDGAAMYQAERGIHSKTQVLSGILANLNQEQTTLTNQTTALNRVQTEHASVVSLIDTAYGRLKDQCTEYTTCAALTDIDPAAAAAQAESFVRTGLQEGEDALPHVRPSVTILDRQMGNGILGIRLLDQQITEVREHESPVLTKSVGSLEVTARIRNDGDRAGTITVVIGGISDLHPSIYAPQTITVSLEPGQEKDFIAVVQIPQGRDATGSVRMQLGSPDEDAVVETVKNREPRPMDAASYIQGEGAVLRNAKTIAMTEGTVTSAERLQKYLAANPQEAASIARKMAMGEITESLAFTQMFTAAQQESVRVADARAEEVVRAIQAATMENGLTAESLLLAQATVGAFSSEGVSMGLSSALSFIRLGRELHTIPQAEIYANVMNRYQDVTPDTYPIIQGVVVRDDTAAGKAFMSVFQQGFGGAEDQQKLRLLELSSITGVSAERIWLGMKDADAQVFFSILKTEYIRVGLDDIFLSPSSVQPASSGQISFGLFSNSPREYTSGSVHLSWDIPAGKTVDYMAIYQTDVNGSQSLKETDIPLTGYFKGKLSIDIPLSDFRSSGPMKLKLAIWFTDGTTMGEVLDEAITIKPSTLQEEGKLYLSQNPDAKLRAIEDYIFNNSVFPVENPSAWHQTFGSSAHSENSFNAVDLNLSGDDKGQPIHAMADGTIIGIDQYTTGSHASHIDILHEADILIDGTMQHVKWVSQYLHMSIQQTTGTNGEAIYVLSYNGGSVSLKLGDSVSQNMIIGGVSDVGSPGANHVHVKVTVGNTAGGQSVDINPLLRHLDVESKVGLPGVSGEQILTWNEAAGEWAYETLGIYYHRNMDGSEHWLAMTLQKEEVVWQSVSNAQLSDGTYVTNYTGWIYKDASNDVWEWKNSSWKKITIL